ncbi:MAG: hypothetical protein JWQ23_4390 [Herminiimonas sp.]|nr:hypothetical protein [Herminiimonas sp.]
MKQPLIVVAAFVSGCVLTALLDPLQLAFAQDRPQIRLTPKSNYEHVLSGENIWLFDSSNNQMIGCHFGGAGSAQVVCEKAKVP